MKYNPTKKQKRKRKIRNPETLRSKSRILTQLDVIKALVTKQTLDDNASREIYEHLRAINAILVAQYIKYNQ